jgi:hypothetical protein
MNMNDQQQAPQPWRSAAVISGESSDHNDGDDDSSNADDSSPLFSTESAGPDEFYDPHEDECDEAFVYKHMRCGLPETVQVRNASNTDANNKSIKALKPRSSDAVLSCPCCFEIVCMDCQQHDRHPNQFRAMFVMNVAVHWDHVLVYDAAVQGLVRTTEHAPAAAAAAAVSTIDSHTNSSIPIPPESLSDSNSNSNNGGTHEDSWNKVETKKDAKTEYYYQTVCAHCQTQVAALDMTDEVYHFYGCLASF